jgi:hypothetical protein
MIFNLARYLNFRELFRSFEPLMEIELTKVAFSHPEKLNIIRRKALALAELLPVELACRAQSAAK